MAAAVHPNRGWLGLSACGLCVSIRLNSKWISCIHLAAAHCDHSLQCNPKRHPSILWYPFLNPSPLLRISHSHIHSLAHFPLGGHHKRIASEVAVIPKDTVNKSTSPARVSVCAASHQTPFFKRRRHAASFSNMESSLAIHPIHVASQFYQSDWITITKNHPIPRDGTRLRLRVRVRLRIAFAFCLCVKPFVVLEGMRECNSGFRNSDNRSRTKRECQSASRRETAGCISLISTVSLSLIHPLAYSSLDSLDELPPLRFHLPHFINLINLVLHPFLAHLPITHLEQSGIASLVSSPLSSLLPLSRPSGML